MSVIDEDGWDWETMSAESSEEAPEEEGGQPSEAEAEPEQEATAPEGTERLRNERGQFVKAQEEQQEEPEPELDDALAKAAERHGTDDPEKLLKIIADQTEHTRNLQSQLDKLLNQQQQQLEYAQQQAEPSYDYDEMAEEDPQAAALTAWERQDPAFTKAWQAWAEDDPGNAAAWLAQTEIGMLRKEMEERTAPLYAQNAQQQQQAAVAHFGKTHPDVTEHAATMARIIEERPYWKIPLEQGPIEAKIQVLTDAYNASKALAAGTLTDASQQVGKAQAQATQEALNDAFVASASNAVREAPEQSVEDQIAEGWDKSGLYWGK